MRLDEKVHAQFWRGVDEHKFDFPQNSEGRNPNCVTCICISHKRSDLRWGNTWAASPFGFPSSPKRGYPTKSHTCFDRNSHMCLHDHLGHHPRLGFCLKPFNHWVFGVLPSPQVPSIEVLSFRVFPQLQQNGHPPISSQGEHRLAPPGAPRYG